MNLISKNNLALKVRHSETGVIACACSSLIQDTETGGLLSFEVRLVYIMSSRAARASLGIYFKNKNKNKTHTKFKIFNIKNLPKLVP